MIWQKADVKSPKQGSNFIKENRYNHGSSILDPTLNVFNDVYAYKDGCNNVEF